MPRTEIMVAEDKARIAELLARGYRNKSEIARLLNKDRDEEYHISAATVTKAIKDLQEEYLSRGFEDLNIYRQEAILELQYLLTVYYDGYEKSKKNKITVETTQIAADDDEYNELFEGAEDVGNTVMGRAGKVKEEETGGGNPAFLNGIKACLDSLNRIRGVDGTSKIAITDPTGTQDHAGDALELIKSRMAELSERQPAEDYSNKLLSPMPVDIDDEQENDSVIEALPA